MFSMVSSIVARLVIQISLACFVLIFCFCSSSPIALNGTAVQKAKKNALPSKTAKNCELNQTDHPDSEDFVVQHSPQTYAV